MNFLEKGNRLLTLIYTK